MDQSEIAPIHIAARCGDFDSVKTHLEVLGTDVNAVDEWNSTPLYYACLAGHIDVVKYLIEMGAECEENTYQGERCLYAALTNELRQFLRSHRLTVAHRSAFSEFFRVLWESKQQTDLVMEVGYGDETRCISLHRSVLCARCPYFYERLSGGDWQGRSVINCRNRRLDPDAFEAVLRFLYTGKLEVPSRLFEATMRICLFCKLDGIASELEKAKQTNARSGGKFYVQDSRAVFEEDMRNFCRRILRTFDPTADLCVRVAGRMYAVHRAFLCVRSEHFRVMMSSGFAEATALDDDDSALPTIELHEITPAVFEAVVEYCYTDTVHGMGFKQDRFQERRAVTEASADEDDHNRAAEFTFDVLQAAERFLLPGLKVLCGSVLTQLMANDPGLVFAALEASRVYQLPRLEDACHKIIALHLDEICETEEFPQLVLADAMAIKGRQVTDSIPLVDDIRHHITQLFAFVPAQGGGGGDDDDGDTNNHHWNASPHRAALNASLEQKEFEYGNAAGGGEEGDEDDDEEFFFLENSEAFRRHRLLDNLLQRLNLAGTAFRDRRLEL